MKFNFWNDAAKYGAILGALLSASTIIETSLSLSGVKSLYMLILFEWIAVVVVHYYLLHRFTRSRSQLYTPEEGFTFGQGYAYLLTISGFAGILFGIVQYIYVHVILGYENYTTKLMDAMTSMISQSGGVPASMEGIFSQIMTQIQTTPEPSVISTVWSGFFMSVLFGALFGLIIAGMLARQEKPFASENNE